jgi:hypothetical protein
MLKLMQMKDFEEFSSNPFLEKNDQKNFLDIIVDLSKSGQLLLRYMIKKESFKKDQIIIDIEDFLNFSGYKNKASGFKALIELCGFGIIARTKFPILYWVNQNLSVDDIKVR